MPTNTPKVFICSTVYDFRDLRSALREWLEEFGYEVLVSERTDFPQSPDSNSYRSCLDAIDKADYFLLFIGSRVGGWYDKERLISITRAEYQHAYERFGQGKLKLLAFVRQEVWDIKEDREALRRFLEDDEAIQKELSDDDRAKIVRHPSKFATNAQAIFEFIDEVRKVGEMKQAEPGAGPPGNWVYQFTSFKDVIGACKMVFDLSGNLRHHAIVASLIQELEANLALFVMEVDGDVMPLCKWSAPAAKCFHGSWTGVCDYKGRDLAYLGVFLTNATNIGRGLRTVVLEEAITSGEFLEYEKTSGRFRAGRLHQTLCDLSAQIQRMRQWDLNNFWDIGIKLEKNQEYWQEPDKWHRIPNHQLSLGVYAHNVYENTLNCSQALYAALQGDSSRLGSLRLNPPNAISEGGEGMTVLGKEPSPAKLKKWLKSLAGTGD